MLGLDVVTTADLDKPLTADDITKDESDDDMDLSFADLEKFDELDASDASDMEEDMDDEEIEGDDLEGDDIEGDDIEGDDIEGDDLDDEDMEGDDMESDDIEDTDQAELTNSPPIVEEQPVPTKSDNTTLPVKATEKEAPKPSTPSGKYIPPALRGEANALDRRVRGHLNKLSSSNLYAIAHEFTTIYQTNARKLVSASVMTTIYNQVVQPTPTPLLLIEDYSCFIIIIHQMISTDISTYIIEEMITKYLSLQQLDQADSKLSNLLSLICCLTRLQLFKTKLIVEILETLIKRFSIDDVKCIQMMLNSSAFTIRKEDPAALKSIILAVHQKVRDDRVELESAGGSRVKFILETLTNVKNNNLNATKSNPGFIDKDRDDTCKKRIRSVVGKVQLEPMPAIGVSDILQIEERGRWWQIGAAIVVKRDDVEKAETVTAVTVVSEKLKSAAKKLRLNTDNKRNIFYLLNTCEDYIDAANKIFALRLKGSNRQVSALLVYSILTLPSRCEAGFVSD